MSCHITEIHKRNLSFCLFLFVQSIQNYLSKMDLFIIFFSYVPSKTIEEFEGHVEEMSRQEEPPVKIWCTCQGIAKVPAV